VIGRGGAGWRDAAELARLVAKGALGALALGAAMPALFVLAAIELLGEHDNEDGDRFGDGATPRELPRVTCGACGVELYDNGTGAVFTGKGWCRRCGTSSFRAVCDRCALALLEKEQVSAIVGAAKDWRHGAS
jgi:hypothetical protein